MFVYLTDNTRALFGPVELPPVPGLGVQVPSNAIELEQALPQPETLHVWALVEGLPQLLPDLRGPVYSTETGAMEIWEELGVLPDSHTQQIWPGPFYVWLDSGWQLDQAAQLADKVSRVLAERDNQLRAAVTRIAPLQDALDLGESTATEEAALVSWKRYRIDLNRIEQQPGYPQSIDWPSAPSTAQTQ